MKNSYTKPPAPNQEQSDSGYCIETCYGNLYFGEDVNPISIKSLECIVHSLKEQYKATGFGLKD